MNNLESFLSSVELSNQTELVNQTEISGFDKSEILSNGEIASHLKELPPSHLEYCDSICYEPIPSEKFPNARGYYDRPSGEIHILGERFAGAEECLATITHEVGHGVHENLLDNNSELANKWDTLHTESLAMNEQNGSGFVSEYAQTSVYEDFAETYRSYVLDPDKLKFFSPDKYEFMRSEVFSGQEYSPRVVGGIQAEGEASWSLFNEQGEPTVLFDCGYDYSVCSYSSCGP